MSVKLMTTDPYTPIRKVRLQTLDGVISSKYSIQTKYSELDTTNDEEELIEGWQEAGVVGHDYLGIPNLQVRELANKVITNTEIKNNYNWKLLKSFWNGRKFKLFFVSDNVFNVAPAIDLPNDDVILGLMYENSYDGSTALGVRLTLTRVICTNGMMSHQYLPGIKILHNLSNETKYEQELGRIESMLETGISNTSTIRLAFTEMHQSYLDTDMIGQIRRNHIDKLPTNIFGKCLDKFIQDPINGHSATVWDLYNAFTGQLWHEENESIANFKWNSYVTDGFINFADKQLSVKE